MQQLSSTIQEVASNAAVITASAEEVNRDAHGTAEECASITAYSVAMKARADDLEQSAKTNVEVTSAKAGGYFGIFK